VLDINIQIYLLTTEFAALPSQLLSGD